MSILCKPLNWEKSFAATLFSLVGVVGSEFALPSTTPCAVCGAARR